MAPWVTNCITLPLERLFCCPCSLAVDCHSAFPCRSVVCACFAALHPSALACTLSFPSKHQPCFAPCPLCPGVFVGPSTFRKCSTGTFQHSYQPMIKYNSISLQDLGLLFSAGFFFNIKVTISHQELLPFHCLTRNPEKSSLTFLLSHFLKQISIRSSPKPWL